MKIKQKIDQFFEGVVFVQKKLTACLMLLMIVLVSLQVIARLVSAKIPWTEELATYSLIWMTFIGSIGVLIKGEHLTVDLFLVRYKPSQRRVVRIFVDLVSVVFCGLLLYFGIQLCINPLIRNGRTPALAISRVWIYLSLPISMGFSTLYSVYDLAVAIIDCVTGGRFCTPEGGEAV